MKTKILIAFILVALIMACSTEFSDDNFLVEPPESFDDLMLQGWSAFETQRYSVAVETFSAAAERKATLPEVYLGLGWSNIRDLNLENGRIYLGSAISFAFLDVENGDQIILDAMSGLAGIALAEGAYDQAIEYADAVILGDPGYEFSHDSGVNLDALKRIRMTAAYYRGDYADAFQDILDLGLTMESVQQETPTSGTVQSLAAVDSGFVPVAGDTLTTPWLKMSVPGHALEVGDYYILTGLSDAGNSTLTPLVDNLLRVSGWKVKYLLSGGDILVTAIDSAQADLVSTISLSSPNYMEATGSISHIDGTTLNGVVQVDVYSHRHLVYVNSISAMVDDGASYTITSVEEGGSQFQIFGNPVFSAGPRVLVDYYHTDDFGLFLSELIDLVSNIE